MKNTKEPRPCSVKGLTGCLFLGFFEEDQPILQVNAFYREVEKNKILQDFYDSGFVSDCLRVELLHKVFAIVEMPDGTVNKANPEDIVFLDREVSKE